MKLTIAIIGLIGLLLGLYYGCPVEFPNQEAFRDGLVLRFGVVALLFLFIIWVTLGLKKDWLKISLAAATPLISIPYTWIGAWTLLSHTGQGGFPMWEDEARLESVDGRIVVEQFVEMSGSLHDYQKRMIFREFESGHRLSIRVNHSYTDSTWKKVDLK